MLRHSGFEGIPIVNVEGACASATMALHQSVLAIKSGCYDLVLAVGAEKMYLGDTAKSIAAMSTNTDVEIMGKIGFQFPASYAMTLRKYMQEYGWTQEHFAKTASKNKYNGSLNPYAQYQKPMSVEQILKSRLIVWPLTLYMCSTMADGAAAALVCSQDFADRHNLDSVKIAACVLRSGEANIEDDGQRRIAKDAYEIAGLGPEDMELAEVHDAMAPGEMFRIEKLDFCQPEEIGELVDNGYFTLKGELPVNSSGGLASRGHPIGATGLAQIHELVTQLRGKAGPRQIKRGKNVFPRVALAQNSGGYIEGSPAALTVTILTK
jgi:acetyl-CoA acetyltransferase